MSKVLVLYRWRVRDPVSGRMIKTRHLATEDEIRRQFPDAERIESSREERVISDDPWAQSTSAFLRNK